jgi:2-keto-4-pentenoate hydratase/2-oxohepta-3-ene-1,7-dioic acid hydratase in catechol pathway
VLDAIDKGAELRRRHGDDVAHLVREALTGRMPVLGRSEHRAEKEHLVWLKEGDVMTLGIDGLGEQRQNVVPYRKGR